MSEAISPTVTSTDSEEEILEGNSLWSDAWLRLKKNKMAYISLYYLIGITLLSLLGPPIYTAITSIGIDTINPTVGGTPPLEHSIYHLFGTDELGRDLFVRTLQGGTISLGVGLAATAVSILIGITYGAISGYLGGKTDNAMMRFVDILYGLPFTIFVILLTTIFERSLILLFIAIGAVEWLTMARIIRSSVSSFRNMECIEAAHSLGLPHSRILFRHILPNVMGPAIIYTTLTVPRVILLESFLSFLGLGVQAPMSSWGSLIKEGADRIDVYPWLLLFPALLFSATLFALNFLGDGLRDALDPRASKD